MWCTRWLLPLMFLPVPTAPPYFLVLFLISALFHARPCMHCIIVLATLFVTSCYWSAVPANTISPEVFDKLNITLTNATNPLWAPVNGSRELKWDQPIQLLSRCWCDFTRTPFFDNLDVGAWERDSVFAHPIPAPQPSPPPSESAASGGLGADSVLAPGLNKGNKDVPPSLTRKLLGYVVPKRYLPQSPPSASYSTASTSASTSSSASSDSTVKGGGGFVHRWLGKGGDAPDKQPAPPSPHQPARMANTNPATATSAPPPSEVTPPAPSPKLIFRPLFIPGILLRPITHWRFRWPSRTIGKVQGPKLPWLRRRYDLSRHGIGIVLDFGWGRGEPIGPA